MQRDPSAAALLKLAAVLRTQRWLNAPWLALARTVTAQLVSSFCLAEILRPEETTVMNETALLHDTGQWASISRTLLQVQVVVELKRIFKRIPNLV